MIGVMPNGRRPHPAWRARRITGVAGAAGVVVMAGWFAVTTNVSDAASNASTDATNANTIDATNATTTDAAPDDNAFTPSTVVTSPSTQGRAASTAPAPARPARSRQRS